MPETDLPLPLAADVEAVLAASRVLVAVAAQSLDGTDEIVTVPQLRAMMILATRGPLSLTTLADQMGVHPSNATRACDKLVTAGFLDRRDDPANRRQLLLDLTSTGRELIDGIQARRRTAISSILQRMPASQRRGLVRVLTRFAAAAGEPEPTDLRALGWVD